MDRYEYKLKSDQIKKLYEENDFDTLLNVAKSFDWRKINNNVLLNIVADAYEQVGKLDEAIDLLLMAYDRTTFGRNLAYRLCLLSIKLGRMAEAVDFYTDFVRKAPKDPSLFILKYEILRAKKAPVGELIKALESYLLLDIDEKWEYELALLYHEAGHGVKCIEMCNEISLWFSDSDYVRNALELKQVYMPLTEKQERKYKGLPETNNEYITQEQPEEEYQEEGYETFKYSSEEDSTEENSTEDYSDEYLTEEQAMLMGAVKAVTEFTYEDEDIEEIKSPELQIQEETPEEIEVQKKEETLEEALEDIDEEISVKIEDQEIEEQIEGQLTLESLLEEYKERQDEELQKEEQERLARAALIAEKTRLLREEIERQNEIELDGPFGDIFAREMAEQEECEEEEIEQELQQEELEAAIAAEEEAYCLSHEHRNIFERYLPINKMEEQLAVTLENLINRYEEDGTSSYNNIVIMGDEKSGKTSLIIDIIKVVNRERQRNGRKVAKIKGESLNRKGMALTMPKLFGADLIIERAGNLNPETVQDLVKAMKDYTEDMIVILEDSEVALERLFKVNSEIIDIFDNIIKIKEIGVKEWVEVAKDYARKRGYIVDEMGTLALHVKIGNAYSRELKLETEEIEKIIDEAIEKSKRKKRYSKKHKIEGFAVLREADFM